MRLHVNIDHVATVRNARGTPYPDPVRAALVCVDAGADGITAHLREDRRHIRDDDVARLRAALGVTFTLEMAATDEMVGIAVATRPEVVTLVPERREERTTEGGLDVAAEVARGDDLRRRIGTLLAAGVRVSLFIAADEAQIRAARELGVQQIELHTGEYAHPRAGPERARQLDRLRQGATLAHGLGLEVAAGHGLTRENVVDLVQIPEIVELNIGHAMVADALLFSMAGAVVAMRDAIVRGRA